MLAFAGNSVLTRLALAETAIDPVAFVLSQLVVPVLAMAAGMVFLEEVLTIKFIVACGLVVSGVAISLGLHRSFHLK